MKPVLALLALLVALGYQPCLARKQGQARIDSLLQQLPLPMPGKNRLNLLNELAREYFLVNPTYGEPYVAQATRLAQTLNNKPALAHSYLVKGKYLSRKDQNQQAEEFLKEAFALYRQSGDAQGLAEAYLELGNHYFQTHNYTLSLEHLHEAVKLFDSQKNSLGIAKAAITMGQLQARKKEYEKALHSYQKALKTFEAKQEKGLQARVLTRMGSVYTFLHDHPKALELLGRARALAEEIQSTSQLCLIAQEMGIAYTCKNQFEQTYAHGLTTAALAREIASPKLIMMGYSLLGNAYLGAAEIKPDVHTQSPPYNLPLAERYRLAEYYYQKATGMADSMHIYGAVNDFAGKLFMVAKARGDYRKALEWHKKMADANDSISAQLDRSKIASLEYKFAADLKQKELEIQGLQLQKAENQRWYLGGAVGLLLLLSGSLFNRFRLKQRKNRELERAYADLQKLQEELLQKEKSLFAKALLETELKALRAQMNPHFIFNCLNSIQAFILRENRHEATEYLQKFSCLIRLILDNSQKTSTTIEDETEILTLYLDLERLRLKGKFDYEIDIPEDLDTGFTEFPSMVIQPLVENSIWHGLMPAQQPGHLRISFRKEESQLLCVVEDNGIGIARSQELKGQTGHESKGLKLIQDRLNAWSQTRDLHCRVRVLGTTLYGTGTRTEITIQHTPEYAATQYA